MDAYGTSWSPFTNTSGPLCCFWGRSDPKATSDWIIYATLRGNAGRNTRDNLQIDFQSNLPDLAKFGDCSSTCSMLYVSVVFVERPPLNMDHEGSCLAQVHSRCYQPCKRWSATWTVRSLDFNAPLVFSDGEVRLRNVCISNAWKIQKFAIVPRDFSIQTGGFGRRGTGIGWMVVVAGCCWNTRLRYWPCCAKKKLPHLYSFCLSTGEFTPSLKLKRSVAEATWKELIDPLY